MLLLAAVLLVQQGGWRPTTDNVSRFPTDLKPAARAAVLARLDPLLPIIKAALTTDGVQFQAARSFADDPSLPGGPWPLNVSLYGYEASARFGFEGEAATVIDVFANDLSPMLYTLLDEPRTYRTRDQPGVFMLTRGTSPPWKPVSQREFARRLRTYLTPRAARDRMAKMSLDRLEADYGAASDAPMLLPENYHAASSGYWPGLSGAVHQVVDLDSSYFAGRPRDALEVLVLKGGVNNPWAHPVAARRLRAFWTRLDRDALRRLLQ